MTSRGCQYFVKSIRTVTTQDQSHEAKSFSSLTYLTQQVLGTWVTVSNSGIVTHVRNMSVRTERSLCNQKNNREKHLTSTPLGAWIISNEAQQTIREGSGQACHWEAYNEYIGNDFLSASQALQHLDDCSLVDLIPLCHQFHFHIRTQIQISSLNQNLTFKNN